MDTDLQPDGAFCDLLGETHPLWAILSDPARRGRRWDLATFFGTEEREISTLMHQLSSWLKGQSFPRESALDFGCGVGRLSQALARYFDTLPREAAASASPAHELSRWDDDLLTPYLQAATENDVAFPMFGVPRDEPVAFVTARGAALMLAEPGDRGGREWEGFRYFFGKVN